MLVEIWLGCKSVKLVGGKTHILEGREIDDGLDEGEGCVLL